MSEVTVDQDVMTRELWHVEFRADEGGNWNAIGTERADLSAVLRVYDFWKENHPDVELRFRQTNVSVKTVDIAELREREAETKSSSPRG